MSVEGLPSVVRVEPASSCNLRCVHCTTSNGNHPKGIMTPKTWEVVLQELKEIRPKTVVLYHGGEPFLNSNIFSMIRELKELGVDFVKTVTNGMSITEDMIEAIILSGLDSIEFSLDGTSIEENERIRVGCDYHRVMRTVKRLNELKHTLRSKTPSIFIANCQFPSMNDVISGRQPEIPEYLKAEFPEGVRFKVCWAILWRGMTKGKGIEQIADHCDHQHNTLTIRHNGDVVACCYDITSTFVLGNVLRGSIREIWNNDAFRGLRRATKARQPHALCQGCHVIYKGGMTFETTI